MNLQPLKPQILSENMFQHLQMQKTMSLYSSTPTGRPSFFKQSSLSPSRSLFPPPLSWFNKRHLSNIDPFRPSPVKVEEHQPFPSTNYKHYHPAPYSCRTEVKLEEKTSPQKFKEDLEIEYQKRIHNLVARSVRSNEEIKQIKEYRKTCMQRYFQKKLKRCFQKKIVYDTRKRVADRRIRFKGKFINEHQAKQLLGLDCGDFSFDELKELMKKLKREEERS